MMNLLRAIIAHCIGDYLLQQCNIVKDKKNNWNLLIHCILYTGSIYFVFKYEISTIGYYIIFISHFIIDYIKAHGYTPTMFGSYKRALFIDQIIHFIVLISCI